MKREDLIGRTITQLLRTDIDFVEGTGLPGVSRGVYEFFTLILELDNRELLRYGQSRESDPLDFVPVDKRDGLTELDLPDDQSCVGETINGVFVHYDSIVIRLSSERYLLVDDGVDGTEIDLTDPDDMDEESLEDYWSPIADSRDD